MNTQQKTSKHLTLSTEFAQLDVNLLKKHQCQSNKETFIHQTSKKKDGEFGVGLSFHFIPYLLPTSKSWSKIYLSLVPCLDTLHPVSSCSSEQRIEKQIRIISSFSSDLDIFGYFCKSAMLNVLNIVS